MVALHSSTQMAATLLACGVVQGKEVGLARDTAHVKWVWLGCNHMVWGSMGKHEENPL